MNNRIYRKIWESAHGPIPRDSQNRSYEIHHIDGNHSNNSLDNLQLVTIQEHYEIHFNQKDYGACNQILLRMNLPPSELSRRISESNRLRVGDKNPFYGKKHTVETINLIKSKLTNKTYGPRSESTKTAISNALSGKVKTSEHKKSIKAAHNTQEYLDKMYKRIIVDETEYKSVKDAIEYSGLSRSQIYNLIRKNSDRVKYIDSNSGILN